MWASPADASSPWIEAFFEESMSDRTRFCCAVMMTGIPSRSMIALSVFLPSPLMRPPGTWMPYDHLPSPWSTHPR